MADDLFAASSLSVSQLNAMAKNVLERSLTGLWVTGEVSNLTRAASGHCYFVLKDAQAQVRCTLFRQQIHALAAPIQDGDLIEVCGKITLYEARGEFQINVAQLRRCGLGQWYEAYERLRVRLQAEGLFDAAKKRPLPMPPACIGIITSPAAAALRDVVSTLRRRAPDVPLVLYPTAVQGVGSGLQVAQAVEQAAKHGMADVLIVCRGGGSIEDLWAFNEEKVVRAVAASPIPIVSGVGHETDFTLTDFAADLRAPTPTAAAELVSPNRVETVVMLRHWQQRLQQAMWQKYRNSAQRLDDIAQNLQHPRQRLAAQALNLQHRQHTLQRSMTMYLAVQQQHLGYLKASHATLRPDVAFLFKQCQQAERVLHGAVEQAVAQRRAAVSRQEQLLQALSPQRVLARGYSMVLDEAGRVVRDADKVAVGSRLQVRLHRGSLNVRTLPDVHDGGQGDLFM